MARPRVPQGTQNRLKASIIIPDYPELNVTASFLLPEGIDMTFEGQTTAMLPTMTGACTSPEPYQMARVTAHLIKAQGFANQWKTKKEANSLLGDGITIRPDTSTIDPWILQDCSITGVDRLSFGGRDAGYVLAISGVWEINADLWE